MDPNHVQLHYFFYIEYMTLLSYGIHHIHSLAGVFSFIRHQVISFLIWLLTCSSLTGKLLEDIPIIWHHQPYSELLHQTTDTFHARPGGCVSVLAFFNEVNPPISELLRCTNGSENCKPPEIKENNLFSSHLDIGLRQSSNKISRFAKSNNIEAVTLDGNNIIEVYDKAKKIIKKIRKKSKPFLIE